MMGNRIMELNRYKDTVFYRAACACTDPDCDVFICLEKDNGQIVINFDKKILWLSDWVSENWLGRQWYKLKTTFNIWIKGYIELNGEFIIDKEEQMNSFIKALEEGREYLKNEKNRPFG